MVAAFDWSGFFPTLKRRMPSDHLNLVFIRWRVGRFNARSFTNYPIIKSAGRDER